MNIELIWRISLLIIDVFVLAGMFYLGRQLRKIRVLMEKGADRITEYVSVVLSQEEETAAPSFVSEEERRLATEEKKMLFSFDPEPVLNEFMGDFL